MISRRTTLPLLLLFLTLLALFLWQQQEPDTPPETAVLPTAETVTPLFPNQSLFLLREISVRRINDAAIVQLTHNGQGRFTLIEPVAAAADDTLLLNQLGAFSSAGSRRTLTGNLAEFGLDAPTHQLSVTFENATVTLAVGNLAPNPAQIYLLRDGDILLLQTAVVQPLLDWIDEPPAADN